MWPFTFIFLDNLYVARGGCERRRGRRFTCKIIATCRCGDNLSWGFSSQPASQPATSVLQVGCLANSTSTALANHSRPTLQLFPSTCRAKKFTFSPKHLAKFKNIVKSMSACCFILHFSLLLSKINLSIMLFLYKIDNNLKTQA